MTIYRVKPDDFETFSVTTHPLRTFSTSSAGEVGSIYVYPTRSDVEKDVSPASSFVDAPHDDADISSAEKNMQSMGALIRQAPQFASSSLNSLVSQYMVTAERLAPSLRKRHTLSINRWTPTVRFTPYTNRKLIVKDILNHYYRVTYPSANWAYTNYHSLNFFTASTVPTGSALLYPNLPGGQRHDGYVSGTYVPSGAFSFDFYINPRYKSPINDTNISVGTILHLSSTFALSLIPGSITDIRGRNSTYRLKLQLSHSADIKPSVATQGSYPNDLIFQTDDNVLKWNNWHHVIVRWGTSDINDGTGSFVIDGVSAGNFVVPSGTIAPKPFTLSGNPDVLVLGNYYEGTNAGDDAQALFFATNPSQRDGIQRMIDDGGTHEEPGIYKFNHPLNAELHDISIKRHYMTDIEIAASSSRGPSSIDTGDVAFYVPPFFTQESPFRQFVGDHGGVFQTPFFEVDGTTDDPFNLALSFGVAGHDINLENFVRDFASNNNPRLHQLTGSAITHTTDALPCNEFLYSDKQIVKRNLTILPCDDGNFMPDFELLTAETRRSLLINDLGAPDPSLIHLDNLIHSGSSVFGTSFEPSSDDTSRETDAIEAFVNEQIGFSPEQPGIVPGPAYNTFIKNLQKSIASGVYDPGIQRGAPLTIYNRTLDPSSNQVAFFNISNLFYGDEIQPGTLTFTDPSFSGSNGQLSMTIADDGYGGLYRADCLTPQATWNNIGNVYYSEGVAVVKSPHLYFFGKDAFSTKFRGTRSVHVLNVHTIADRGHLNSSSNPNWLSLSASNNPADPDQGFVNLTGMYYLDDNFNVIAKSQFAQPITKRFSSRIAFRNKFDF